MRVPRLLSSRSSAMSSASTLPGPTMAHYLAGLTDNNVDMYHPTARSAQECRTQVIYFRQEFVIQSGKCATFYFNPFYGHVDKLYANPATPAALTPSTNNTLNLFTDVTVGGALLNTGGAAVTLVPTGQYAASSSNGTGTGRNRFLGADFSISQQAVAVNMGYSVTSNSTNSQALIAWDTATAAYNLADQASFKSVDGAAYGVDRQGLYKLRYGPELPDQMDFQDIDDWPVRDVQTVTSTAVSGDGVLINSDIYPEQLGAQASKGFTCAFIITPFVAANTTMVLCGRLVYQNLRYTPTADTAEQVTPTVPSTGFERAQPVHQAMINDTIVEAKHNQAKGDPGIDAATVVSRLGSAVKTARELASVAGEAYSGYKEVRSLFATNPKVAIAPWAPRRITSGW